MAFTLYTFALRWIQLLLLDLWGLMWLAYHVHCKGGATWLKLFYQSIHKSLSLLYFPVMHQLISKSMLFFAILLLLILEIGRPQCAREYIPSQHLSIKGYWNLTYTLLFPLNIEGHSLLLSLTPLLFMSWDSNSCCCCSFEMWGLKSENFLLCNICFRDLWFFYCLLGFLLLCYVSVPFMYCSLPFQIIMIRPYGAVSAGLILIEMHLSIILFEEEF